MKNTQSENPKHDRKDAGEEIEWGRRLETDKDEDSSSRN
jgi:hypothetical protein